MDYVCSRVGLSWLGNSATVSGSSGPEGTLFPSCSWIVGIFLFHIHITFSPYLLFSACLFLFHYLNLFLMFPCTSIGDNISA